MKKKSSPPPYKTLLKSAITAAEASGKILKRHFGKKLKISEKKDAGLVTNADLEAQDKSVSILRKARPDFGFLTEEASPEKSRDLGRWIIDPLDGTTNFVHGFPMFCVSIAAEWDGELVAGVIYHPILDELYTATRGQGAFLNGKRIRVSKTRRLKDSLLTTGFTYAKEQALTLEIESFENLSSIARAIRRPGSAALDLAYTARGVFDGFWERRLSPWDIAAGALIVTEAGGKVSDFSGNSFGLESGELLASNVLLHPMLVQELGQNHEKKVTVSIL